MKLFEFYVKTIKLTKVLILNNQAIYENKLD